MKPPCHVSSGGVSRRDSPRAHSPAARAAIGRAANALLVGTDAAAAVGAEGTVVSAASVGAPVELIAHLGFLRKSALF